MRQIRQKFIENSKTHHWSDRGEDRYRAKYSEQKCFMIERVGECTFDESEKLERQDEDGESDKHQNSIVVEEKYQHTSKDRNQILHDKSSP